MLLTLFEDQRTCTTKMKVRGCNVEPNRVEPNRVLMLLAHVSCMITILNKNSVLSHSGTVKNCFGEPHPRLYATISVIKLEQSFQLFNVKC